MLAPRPQAERPRFDLADVVRAHRAELEARHRLGDAERRVLSAIELCRTAALGGHLDVCPSPACGYERPAYNSCRNRHCPKCQTLAQERWIAARAERLLPVGHFHVVFTLPGALRPLARFAPTAIYDALLGAASELLLELGDSRLRARLGITMVLHTWTRELALHPHVHAIVTAGGLARDGRGWVSRPKYLFPVRMMGVLLRAKTMAALARLHADGAFERFADFADPEAFARLMARLAKLRWVVYSKAPFRHGEHVVAYLARYTHRVGLANSRILDVTHDAVTLRTRGKDTVTLAPVELLRRFLLHVLPAGFHKIRHYGLYAGSLVDSKLADARRLLDAARPCTRPEAREAPAAWPELLRELTGRDVDICPKCGGHLQHLPLERAPPPSALEVAACP